MVENGPYLIIEKSEFADKSNETTLQKTIPDGSYRNPFKHLLKDVRKEIAIQQIFVQNTQ